MTLQETTSNNDNNGPIPYRWLHRFAILVCLLTLPLIFLGGQVKSNDSGLAVPDWPMTFGENPITFHYRDWVGGIFHEHFHRVAAGVIAALTVILAAWLAIRKPRPGLHALGFLAVGAVLLQALLGGITVLLLLPVWASSAHAILAQTFFIILVAIVYLMSAEWGRRRAHLVAGNSETSTPLSKGALILLALVYLQLFLGALMRHTEAALAIPDFPTVAGIWIPSFNEASLAWVNAWRLDYSFEVGRNLPDVTLGQMLIHFSHRLGALAVTLATIILWRQARRYRQQNPTALRTMNMLLGLVGVQVALGIITILTQRSPVITSVHVAVGAAVLGMTMLLCLRAWPFQAPQEETVHTSASAHAPSAS
jgi:cytochrome c oxidase assembly protein subunit 15